MEVTLSDEDRKSVAALIAEQVKEDVAFTVARMHKLKPRGMTEVDAAVYIGTTEGALRKSRSTGLLGGVNAPSWIKLKTKVIYLKEDLDSWLDGQVKYIGGSGAERCDFTVKGVKA